MPISLHKATCGVQSIDRLDSPCRIANQTRFGSVAASNTGPAGLDLVPQPDTAIVSSSDAPPAQRRVTPAIYAEGSRSMLHWDLVEYTWTLDNLTDDLVPAVRRSRRFAIVFVVAKAIESSLWTPAQHPRLAFALAMLASYHVIFALTYLSWLSIVSRSRRRAEDFRQKVISRTISHEDVDVWAGLPLRLTNWIADTRSARKRVYESTPQWWPWFLVELLKLTIF